MQTKIAQWGNSNAVRLPNELMAAAGLAPGASVRLVKHKRGVLIEPAPTRPTLAELLRGCKPENTPGEVSWGAPVGRERLP